MERVAATKGMVQKAREQLGFLERGTDVLRMKRDQLAGELNKLLRELGQRQAVERRFEEAFDSAKCAFAVLGYDAFAAAAGAALLMEVTALPWSAVGVVMPEVKIEKRPSPDDVPTATMRKAALELSESVEEAIALAVLEAKAEQLAWALMTTNRKVNALEKVVIPRYKELIRYIEEKLNEQALQEFFVTKRTRDMTQQARERSRTSPT